MIEILICYVLIVGGVAQPQVNETCYLAETAQTPSGYCSFVGALALARDRKVTFCRESFGRTHP